MSDLWKGMKEINNLTTTENGAAAYSSTLNACLDAFGRLGAMQDSSEDAILSVFWDAFNEDPYIAMHILFYMRDVRGGQGIRRPFRIILTSLAEKKPNYVIRNLIVIPEFGRYDDYLCLLDTQLGEMVAKSLHARFRSDLSHYISGQYDQISLLAKWLPSINTSSAQTRRYARMLCKYWNISIPQYRRDLSKLRAILDVVEKKMSDKQWDKIKYDNVPSIASLKYAHAFYRHDKDRYKSFLEKDAAINANAIYPKDIVKKAQSDELNAAVADIMWKNLPNYFGDTEDTAICMVDTSASMWGTPYDVALSLGLYCADKCHGPYHGKFITFASIPQLKSFGDGTLAQKIRGIDCINAGSTNIEAAFDLILNAALNENLDPKDMPSKLYIISDMQFDRATGSRSGSLMQSIKEKFELNGYEMPTLVYWNVSGRYSDGIFQATYGDIDCVICSGYSPSLFKSICDSTFTINSEEKPKLDPITVMYNTVCADRYTVIWA